MKKLLLVLVAVFAIVVSGCNKNELDITRGYDFTLAMRELPFKLMRYSSTDIRLRINPEGLYPDTKYTMSFVQYTGNGTLQNEAGEFLAPNVSYDLANKIFVLKYTSYGVDDHFLEITVSDNFGHVKKQKVKLLNDDSVDWVK